MRPVAVESQGSNDGFHFHGCIGKNCTLIVSVFVYVANHSWLFVFD